MLRPGHGRVRSAFFSDGRAPDWMTWPHPNQRHTTPTHAPNHAQATTRGASPRAFSMRVFLVLLPLLLLNMLRRTVAAVVGHRRHHAGFLRPPLGLARQQHHVAALMGESARRVLLPSSSSSCASSRYVETKEKA